MKILLIIPKVVPARPPYPLPICAKITILKYPAKKALGSKIDNKGAAKIIKKYNIDLLNKDI